MKRAVHRAKVSGHPELDKIEMDAIAERFKDNPLVQRLEQDPEWTNTQRAPYPDTDPYPFVWHADPYSITAMGGPKGFQSKCYYNNTKAMMVFMVYFGEGVEGEPYFVHEGAVASFLEDSFDWMSGFLPKGQRSNFYTHTAKLTTRTAPGSTSDQSSAVTCNKTLQVDYIRHLRSGQVYCFWMIPAFVLAKELPVADIMHEPEFGVRKMTEDEVERTLVGMIEQRTTPLLSSAARNPVVAGAGSPYARARVTYDPPRQAEPFPPGLEVTASGPKAETANLSNASCVTSKVIRI